jgi:hypothetical protein
MITSSTVSFWNLPKPKPDNSSQVLQADEEEDVD